MAKNPSYPFQPGVLTVSLHKPNDAERLDELSAALHRELISDGVGRFLWQQSARKYDELVFHILGERAVWVVRAELDRLGYDRQALVVTDFTIQPRDESYSSLSTSTN